MDIYKPTLLEKAKEEIFKKHTEDGQLTNVNIDDKSLKEIISKIVSLDVKSLQGFAYTLSKREVFALTSYIFTNQYKVDLRPIIFTIVIRNNESVSKKVYEGWQQVYDSSICAKIFSMFAKDPKSNELISKISRININNLIKAMSEKTIINLYVGRLKLFTCKSLKEYKGLLATAGILEDRKLGKALIDRFYCFCSKDALLDADPQYIYEFIRYAPQDICLGILRNFINRLSIDELSKFNNLIPVFIKCTGRQDSDLFNSLLSGFEEFELKQYSAWICDYDMEDAFKNDKKNDRYLFWRRFTGNCKSEARKEHDMFVMDFGNFVVVEFMTIGTLYWFSKDVYNNSVREKLSKGTTDLKSWLFNYSNFIKKKSHNGNWMSDAAYTTNNLMRR